MKSIAQLKADARASVLGLVGVCGVAQLSALGVYPAVSRRFNRRQLYTLATVLVLAGYAIFFFAEISIILVALGAVLVFVGQAFIQTLMLMFLADTVEYGQWKLGKRNESITFSVQPLINKIGGALSTLSTDLVFSKKCGMALVKVSRR